MTNPYERCPVYENENYLLRMVEASDASDLLLVYSVELFNRKADDYFHNCGLLRLDLRSDYEQEEKIFEILSLIIPSAYKLFECRMIATKIQPFASERSLAVTRLGFIASDEKLIGGHDKKIYTDYYVL